MTGEIVTAAGVLLAVRSINGDSLAVINTSQPPSDSILSVTSCTFSDWLDTNWYVTGHQSGAVKVWKMGYSLFEGKIIRISERRRWRLQSPTSRWNIICTSGPCAWPPLTWPPFEPCATPLKHFPFDFKIIISNPVLK